MKEKKSGFTALLGNAISIVGLQVAMGTVGYSKKIKNSLYNAARSELQIIRLQAFSWPGVPGNTQNQYNRGHLGQLDTPPNKIQKTLPDILNLIKNTFLCKNRQ